MSSRCARADTTDVQRRSFVLGTTLAASEVAASWLGFGAGACGAPASGPALLRAGTLGGVEEEVLRFVAASTPALGLKVVRLGAAREIRAALCARKLHIGSFETGPDLADPSVNPSGKLVSAGQGVTLPLAFYSRKLARCPSSTRGRVWLCRMLA